MHLPSLRDMQDIERLKTLARSTEDLRTRQPHDGPDFWNLLLRLNRTWPRPLCQGP